MEFDGIFSDLMLISMGLDGFQMTNIKQQGWYHTPPAQLIGSGDYDGIVVIKYRHKMGMALKKEITICQTYENMIIEISRCWDKIYIID